MLRTFLGTLSVAALVAMPTFAEQHIEADEELSVEVEDAENAAADLAPANAALREDGFNTTARASVMDRDGNQVGTVTINRTLSGTPLVIVALNGLPTGVHAMHLHEIGDCSAEDFSSAGGHISGDAEHGIFVENGPHPGDLPNGIFDDGGELNAEFFQPNLDLEQRVFDDDGSAFVVHSGADDYRSQPSGDSGERIACGVFEDA